jgi:hypothetical protein
MAFSDMKLYVDNHATTLSMDVVNGLIEDIPAWTNEEKEEFVRGFRNEWLKASDWTQSLDSPLSDSAKQAWAIYRQQLRDMMSVESIDDVVVPTPPRP